MTNSFELDVESCPFCTIDPSKMIAKSELAFAIRDVDPVTPLHTLILPRRHTVTYFDLRPEEVSAVDELLRKVREGIIAEDSTVEGFNIGINVGSVAGQTVFHCHVHLFPRRRGDVADPFGGVRAVVPEKVHPRG